MLNKIGIFGFFVSFILTWYVGYWVPSIHSFLSSEQTTVEVASLKVPILYIVPPLALALIARIIRLHDKLSDIFRIRERFDLNKILIPLAHEVGLSVDPEVIKNLTANRDEVMERTFYAYASFEDPKISKALVLGAIELWTWYWTALEAAVFLIVAAIVLLWNQANYPALIAFMVASGLVLIFLGCFRFCGKRAAAQISEIVNDGQRADAIRVQLLRYFPNQQARIEGR